MNLTPAQENYFCVLDKFLGDQKASYNQELKFKLRVGEAGAIPRQGDLIIIAGGKTPIKISLSLTDQNNPVPGIQVKLYSSVIVFPLFHVKFICNVTFEF